MIETIALLKLLSLFKYCYYIPKKIKHMYVKIITYFLSFFDKVNKNKVIEFFKKNITEDIVNFIDVGAHHAETVKLFDKELIIKNFFCFECSPLNFKFLIKEIKRMNKSSIKSPARRTRLFA